MNKRERQAIQVSRREERKIALQCVDQAMELLEAARMCAPEPALALAIEQMRERAMRGIQSC